MVTLALAAGYATRMYPLTERFPKPLLPVAGRTILDRLLKDLDGIEAVERHIVVSNHKFIGAFEDWRAGADLRKPVTLIDDGTMDNEGRLGAVKDIVLAIEAEQLDDDVFVLAADNLLDFSLGALVEGFMENRASRIFVYAEEDEQKLRRCGVATLDDAFRLVEMEEKPQRPKSRWAIPPFYLYAREDVKRIREAVAQRDRKSVV